MAFQLIPLLAGMGGGMLTEKFLSSGSSGGSGAGGIQQGGMLELATWKKYETKKTALTYAPTYAPTTTTTTTRTDVYSPYYEYAPQLMLGSTGVMTSKKDVSPTVSPTVTPTVTPQIMPYIAPTQAEQISGGGGSSFFQEIKPLLLLGTIGYGAYLLLKKKK